MALLLCAALGELNQTEGRGKRVLPVVKDEYAVVGKIAVAVAVVVEAQTYLNQGAD